MIDMLKRIQDLEDRILSCVAIGDCRGALKGSFNNPILESTCPMRDHGPGFEAFFARGRFTICRALLDEKIKPSDELAEILYQCNLCGACREVCNNPENPCMTVTAREYIEDHIEIWEALRADLVDVGVAPPARHREIFEYEKKEHNPYFEKHDDRLNWIPEKFRFLEKGGSAFFFIGCTSAYRLNFLSKSFLEIANKTGIDLSISPEEWCCGSINLRTGVEKLFQDLAHHNFEVFKKMEVDKIVTTCAGCYKTLKIDYPKYINEWDFDVLHALEMIDQGIQSEKIKIMNKIEGIITYHDPCHLGRHAGIFEAPRNVINAIRKDEFVEMRRKRKYSYCCGAGGGVKSAFPDLALEIAMDRVNEAIETGATYLTTACPFCVNNLKEASEELNSDIKVVDLLELVKKAI
jgi:heterodisulfide reductase subunit D